jgi:hypothetical protein
MTHDLIRQSLETVADRLGDPAPQVYARLFAARPEIEPLFIGDRTGAARGEMLAMVFEILLDLAEGGTMSRNLIGSELVNHDGLGVPPGIFASFFGVVADTVRDGVGDAWTAETAAAWAGLLSEADRLTADQAARSGLALA